MTEYTEMLEAELKACRESGRAWIRAAVQQRQDIVQLNARIAELETAGLEQFRRRFHDWTEQTLLPALLKRIGPMVQELTQLELAAAEREAAKTDASDAPM